MLSSDVIFAQSSAKGRSAIALHRISGPGCRNLLAGALKAVRSTPTKTYSQGADLKLQHSKATYGYIVDLQGEIIDDCIITFFEGPRSYTGDDTIEIAAHGNPVISAKLHSLFRKLGGRDALPGEFTQRAFLNGKLDLIRAEAIDQLIHAETFGGIQIARSASTGVVGMHAHEIRSRLISVLAYFEAHIDFAEDEVGSYDAESCVTEMRSASDMIRRLANSYASGLKMREGVKIAFIGEPNAGKSSLYNKLLGIERAIVTEIPGTTRDVLEERFVIDNRDFILSDTAGIRETNDQVEKIGVERSIECGKSADVICLVIDPSKFQNIDFKVRYYDAIRRLEQSIGQDKFAFKIVVLSKSDSWSEEIRSEIRLLKEETSHSNLNIVACSSKAHALTELKIMLEKAYDEVVKLGTQSETPVLFSQRQFDKANLAISTLDQAIELALNNEFPEKIASNLIQTAQHLSELVGGIGTEDVLNEIFSSFCIGK